jgi:hypothetical protein
MMHTRAMGGGRRLALLGAVIVLVGCLLPWYAVGGGEGELSRVVIMAFQRPEGLATILAALATLALIALPFAMHPRSVAVDRGIVFGILAVVVVVAMVLFVVEVLPMPQGLLPTGAYGFWISAMGAVMLARAAFDISREPPRH